MRSSNARDRCVNRPGIRRHGIDFLSPWLFAELRPLYAGMWVQHYLPNKKTTGGNAIMTNPIHSDDGVEATSALVDRRGMLRGAAAVVARALVATGASARDFGRGAEPQRYPDPDIVVIDPK